MRRRARALERRELSLELGDARGQSMALGLERLAVACTHHHNLRLAPRFLYIGVGHSLLFLAAYDLVEVVEPCAEIITFRHRRDVCDGGGGRVFTQGATRARRDETRAETKL